MEAAGESFEERLAVGDTSLFDYVPSQTSEGDRRALLALHEACRELHGSFSYLEIGSHVGGSMQVLIADPRCTSITSIDARPPSQPDDRDELVEYPDNTTERMLERLARVPGADLSKLRTFDAGTDRLEPTEVEPAPQLCFIDGEHTREAALRDARFCRATIEGAGAVCFHDKRVVEAAIDDFVAELGREGLDQTAYSLPGAVFVVELGGPGLKRHVGAALERARQHRAALRASR